MASQKGAQKFMRHTHTHLHKPKKMHHWSCKEWHINKSHLNVTQKQN